MHIPPPPLIPDQVDNGGLFLVYIHLHICTIVYTSPRALILIARYLAPPSRYVRQWG